MAVWETEDEGEDTALPVPLPVHREGYRTSSRTPSRRGSKKSRRSITPPKSSSPPVPSADYSERVSRKHSMDPTMDESISVLDPRRFTPTLHANLVSEILALRRDQDDKLRIIESLEASLHDTRLEHDHVAETLRETTKENRSLKRQLALIEGGTSSALGELARERDEAVDGVAETKERLDAAQRKIKTQEEDSERVHDLWAKDKDAWEGERRKYERSIHLYETRLQSLISDFAAYQAAHEAARDADSEGEGEGEGAKSDTNSVRTMSITNSFRFSLNNSPRKGGKSLADELNFDPYDDAETDADGRDSVLSSRHNRTFSRDSILFRMHQRNMSIDSVRRPASAAKGRLFHPAVLEALEDGVPEDEVLVPPSPPKSPSKSPIRSYMRRTYTDRGVQYSPPPSPPAEKTMSGAPAHHDNEIEANQRKKRASLGTPLRARPAPAAYLISAAAQPVELLDSPKVEPAKSAWTPPLAMKTASTQTDPPAALQPDSGNLSEPEPVFPIILVPSITIHPPTNLPAITGVLRLPQLTKDFGCQVSLPPAGPATSADRGMQTDEIVTERKLAALPAHLQPSSIISRPVSPTSLTSPFSIPKPYIPHPEPIADSNQAITVPDPVPPPPRNPRRLISLDGLSGERPVTAKSTHDAYPGNNDNGPLSPEKAPVRRPQRFSSLFAGFDGNSSDEGDDVESNAMSDAEFSTALSAPRPKGNKSPQPETSGPLDRILMRPGPAKTSRYVAPEPIATSRPLTTRDPLARKQSVRADVRSSLGRQGSRGNRNHMRRSALIQSGIATHQSRPQSPSLTDVPDPPFPIPTRASSRQPPLGLGIPSHGQSTPTSPSEGCTRRKYRSGSIRKSRSSAVAPRYTKTRRISTQSPPSSTYASIEPPGTPGLPPPQDDVATPGTTRTNRDSINGGARYLMTQRARASVSSLGSDAENMAPQQQAVGVVEAIAQTMVGEWMFKYVRRRKSFGVHDGSKDDSSNDRHRRWVWLAPYERAILWSSKQPSTGSALMGKSGRKLTIQSVLDVKDDKAAPKGSAPLFNRSILILTPERALKFTAVSSERHYVWLMALSFLAHSTQAVPDIAAFAQSSLAVPEHVAEVPKRRSGIMDSIRLAKPKNGAPTSPAPSSPRFPPAAEGGFLPSHVQSIPETGTMPSSPMSDIITPSLNDPFGPPVPKTNPKTSFRRHSRDMSHDAAEAPFIPRFTEQASQGIVHGRKRSNTGGNFPPPISFRGFPSPIHGPGSTSSGSYHQRNPTNSTAGNVSIVTGVSSDIYASVESSNHTWGPGEIVGGMFGSGNSVGVSSPRPSDASSRPSSNVLFEAIGTMRMDAFINPLASSNNPNGHGSVAADEMRVRMRSKELRRQKSRSRNRGSYIGHGSDCFGVPAASGRGSAMNMSITRGGTGHDECFVRDDPFGGF